MDPEATLKWIAENINEMVAAPDATHRRAFTREIITQIQDLDDWIAKGGFNPVGRVAIINDGDALIPSHVAIAEPSALPIGATFPYPNKIAPGTPDPRD